MRVLIVEDEPRVVAPIRRALEREGHTRPGRGSAGARATWRALRVLRLLVLTAAWELARRGRYGEPLAVHPAGRELRRRPTAPDAPHRPQQLAPFCCDALVLQRIAESPGGDPVPPRGWTELGHTAADARETSVAWRVRVYTWFRRPAGQRDTAAESIASLPDIVTVVTVGDADRGSTTELPEGPVRLWLARDPWSRPGHYAVVLYEPLAER